MDVGRNENDKIEKNKTKGLGRTVARAYVCRGEFGDTARAVPRDSDSLKERWYRTPRDEKQRAERSAEMFRVRKPATDSARVLAGRVVALRSNVTVLMLW